METGLLIFGGVLAGAFALLGVMLVGMSRVIPVMMLIRPSCDKLFDWAKIALGGQVGPGAAVNVLAIALAILCLVQRPAILLIPEFAAWAAFLLSAGAAQLHSHDAALGLRLLQSLATYGAVFCFPYALVTSRATAVRLLWISLCSSFVPVVFGLWLVATNPGVLAGEDRLESTFTHPNIFAFFLMGISTQILFMFCSRLVTLTLTQRRALTAYICLLLALLLLTKTRSAWIATALIFAVYAIFIDRRWLLGGLVVPAALAMPGVYDRIFDLTSGNTEGGYAQLNSYAWRKFLWQSALQWMDANPSPLLGNGLEMFQALDPIFFPRLPLLTGVGAHNAFLQIYFEMGLIGFCAFAAIFVAVAAHLTARARRDFAGSFVTFLMCLGYLVVFYSDNLLVYLQYQWFFWFTLGTICASTRYLPVPAARGGLPARWLGDSRLPNWQ